MTRPARLGTDLDAVPVANASDRTAPTWEARALAAEARLAALPGEIAAAIRAAGHPDGRHRGASREWALVHCGHCVTTDTAARIAESFAEAQP